MTIFGFMKFAHPEFLYAFAVLLIPIIIHLFNFKRYKTLYFSSLQFLKKIDQETKTIKNIKHYIILALRLLAFVAIVLAFAQPFIPNKSNNSGTEQPVMAIYLDNSHSMSAIGTNGELLNQGKEVVRKLVENAAPGVNFLLVTNDLEGRQQRIISSSELLERIDFTGYSSFERDASAPLNAIKNTLDDEGHKGPRQYIVVSDFQKSTFTFENFKADSSATFYPIQLIPQSYENLYIDSVWFETPIRKINQNNTLNVRVKNTSKQAINNVNLNLKIDTYERQLLIDIPAKGSEVFTINYSDKSTGFKGGKVEISDNQLFFDDSYYFSYEVQESASILIINGEEPLPLPKFVYETDDFFKVTSQAVKQIQLDAVKSSDVVLLNGIQEISSAITSRLLEFVDNGGSLSIIPSKEINLGSYNRLLGQLELPLISKLEDQALRLNTIQALDPFFDGMFTDRSTSINLPLVNAYYRATESGQTNSKSLIQFENKAPLFVKHGGNKKAYMLYSGIDASFGKVGIHALFSALLLRIGGLSQNNNLLAITLGSNDTYRVFRPLKSEGPVHLVAEESELIPPSIRKGAYDYISLDPNAIDQNLNAGIYEVQINDEARDLLAVNYSRSESQTIAHETDEIITLLKERGVKRIEINTVSELEEIERLTLDKPYEYWRILLILSITFLIAEMILLKLWKV